MRIAGLGYLGSLGVSDTDILNPGTVVTFQVHGSSCSGVYEQDIRDGLNNWMSQMVNISSISTNVEGYVPTVVDVTVTAVVTNPIPAGELRGQIIAALAALSQGVSSLNCGGVQLKNNAMDIAPGGTGTAAPPSSGGSPFDLFGLSPITLALVGAVIGLVVVGRR